MCENIVTKNIVFFFLIFDSCKIFCRKYLIYDIMSSFQMLMTLMTNTNMWTPATQKLWSRHHTTLLQG